MIELDKTKFGINELINGIPCDNPINELRDKLAKEMAESYDNLAFFALAPYGITKKNQMENVDRVEIVNAPNTRHFFVDGLYAFSIITIMDMEEFDEKHSYNIKFKYKIEIFEEMVGMRTK